MLFAVILIPFIIAAFINVSFIGSGKELWLAASYYIFNYFVLALASFGVSAAVVSAVGTVPEGIAYSAVVIAFTSILFTCLETLMDIFVWGSPYSKYNYLGASLNQKYQVLNPVLFGRSSAVSLGELHREDVNSKFEWIAPDFKVVIIWLIVAVAVFFFAMYLFQKRKAEISGFTGKSRILNNIVIFAIGFSLFCLSLGIASNFAQGNKIVIYGALIGAAVFLLVYGVLTLILTRSFKQMLSEMKILGLHYGILAVITIVFAFGLFGYASRIPDIKDIKSVSITGIVPDAVVDAGKNGLSGEDINFIYVNMYGTDNNIVFSTEKDLKIITDLHKSVISDGKLVIDSNRDLPWDKQVLGADLKIVYTLKNGKTIERFYSAIKASTINKFLSLENTDSYRSLIKSVLTEPVKANDSEALKSAKEFFQGESSEFSIIPYDLSNESVLKLGSSMKKELLNALSEDLSAMTSEQRFRPESDALGSMIVNGLYSFGDEYGLPEFSQAAPEKEVREGLIEETDVAKVYSFNDTRSFSSISWIQITEDMKNTINFLKTNKMYSLLQGKGEFVSAQIISSIPSRKNALDRNNYYGSNMSLLFNASKVPVQKGGDEYYFYINDFKNSVKVTDKNNINQLIKDSYSSYFNGEGYYVKFKGKDESETVLFVPADKMPQSIASSVANLSDMEIASFYKEIPNYVSY
jgi:hypothetical protein